MRMLLFEHPGKSALLRAAFFGLMGSLTLLFPEFLFSGVFYALLVGYCLLNGIFRTARFFLRKDARTPLSYANLAAGCLILVFGVHCVVFARYLVQVTPVLLSSLLLLEGAAYVAAACHAGIALRRRVLLPLAVMTLLGALAVFIFTFGFGAGGLTGLIQVSGASLLISCACGGALCLTYRRPQKLCTEGEN
ncbi:hypothetical protein [Clostridium sp. D33t1_170424_F3]|uniref:hypothetical protein n=1 Tax=Clostridium sp. D33t1_170424_F3 TaxID=2787099 RepID=UPI0018A8BD1D|nr:hypothetical protein [Clostridium sp. D33t1_170424_F3]